MEVISMHKLISFSILIGVSAGAAMAADAKAGQAVFDKSCKSCHGADGTPNPAVAKMMKVEMRDLRSPEVQAMSDADLKAIIVDGKGKMKPIKTVTGANADNVVAFVRSLKK
jgi:mono/diheme cytochrome c family protein